jgi:hypothetical protein
VGLAIGFLFHPLAALWAPWLAVLSAGRSTRRSPAVQSVFRPSTERGRNAHASGEAAVAPRDERDMNAGATVFTGIDRRISKNVEVRCCFLFGLAMLGLCSVTASPMADSADSATGASSNRLDKENAVAEAIKAQEALRSRLLVMTPEERRIDRERRGRLPIPDDAYDWRAVARARSLSREDVELLARQNVLIGRREFRQSFEIYTDPTVPVFITSDSVLNAFHALFEDTFWEIELRCAPELREHLENAIGRARKLLENPPYLTSELAGGWLQAQRATGPAMVLLGTPIEFFDAASRAGILSEVQKIRDASAVELPSWLGPPTASFLAIDYRRMKPVGFYAGDSMLGDYFRAVRWLQTVPFRVNRDDELTAIALLGYRAGVSDRSDDDFFGSYSRLIGPPSGRGIPEARNLIDERPPQPARTTWVERMKAARKWLNPTSSPLNDDLRMSRADESEAFRVLCPYVLPDAELFQQLADHNEPVSGLQVAALVRSGWASSRLTPNDPKFVAAAIDWARDRIDWPRGGPDKRTPVYSDYLGVLQSLFASPDPDAPPFMASNQWTAKSCQTCLSGWAQMRHTFALQAKLTVVALGMHDQPPGFIEPNPAFFRRMAEFLTNTRFKLDEIGVFTATSASAAAELRIKADLADRLAAQIAAGASLSSLPDADEFHSYVGAFEAMESVPDTEEAHEQVRRIERITSGDDAAAWRTGLSVFSRFLRQSAAEIQKGAIKPPQRKTKWNSLSQRWTDLQETVGRLEALLQKQLRRQPWTDEEARFIKGYGPTMARAMGYFGNMYAPRDDAPRCIEVVRFAQDDTSLIAATGRPRIFYVLYPWRDMNIFCEGVVLPYYEFRSRERLTDQQWRTQLDSPTKPPSLDWLRDVATQP